MQAQEGQPKSSKPFPVLTVLSVLIILFICESVSGAIKSVESDGPSLRKKTINNRSVIVLATSTLPRMTNAQSTVTLIPTPNPIQTARALLVGPHDDGYYLIGINIAPGTWRSQPGNFGCYWVRMDRTGNIIENHLGRSGEDVYLHSSDYQVKLAGCGKWIYLGP